MTPGMFGRSILILAIPLTCSGSVAIPAMTPPTPEQQRIRAWSAAWRSAEYADLIRSLVYDAYGGDRDPRCRPDGPSSSRTIRPIVPIRSMRCVESVYPPGFRACDFVLGYAPRRARCSVEFRERIGIHNPYWSDKVMPPQLPSRRGDGRTAVSFGRSRLACDAPLLLLTTAPYASAARPRALGT